MIVFKKIFAIMLIAFSLSAQEVSLAKDYLDLKYITEYDFDYCIKHAELCEAVSVSKLPKFKIQEPPSRTQWAMFWSLQILDVYSTAKAVEYDCIREVNPLLSERPGTERLVVTKTVILAPALLRNQEYKKIRPKELHSINWLQTIVVANNFNLLSNARKNCVKIR